MGKEVFESKRIESIHKKPDIEFIRSDTSAKTYRGYLYGKLQVARNKNNQEMKFLMEELIKKFDEYYPREIIKYVIKGAEQWRGKNSFEINYFPNDIYITEYRKDKETGEVLTTEPIDVKKEYINYLLGIIKNLETGKHYKARYLFNKIIKNYDLKTKGVDISNFNGGGNHRAKYYFPLYLYPLRVLAQLGLIKLSNGQGGGIIKLK